MLLWLMKTPTQLTDNANAWGNPRQCGKPFPLSPAPPRGNWQNRTTNISITIYAIFGSVNLTPRPALPSPTSRIFILTHSVHPWSVLPTKSPPFASLASENAAIVFIKSHDDYILRKQFHLNCQEKAAALLCKITSNPITKECNSGIRSYKSMPETQIPVIQNTLAEKLESFQFW